MLAPLGRGMHVNLCLCCCLAPVHPHVQDEQSAGMGSWAQFSGVECLTLLGHKTYGLACWTPGSLWVQGPQPQRVLGWQAGDGALAQRLRVLPGQVPHHLPQHHPRERLPGPLPPLLLWLWHALAELPCLNSVKMLPHSVHKTAGFSKMVAMRSLTTTASLALACPG